MKRLLTILLITLSVSVWASSVKPTPAANDYTYQTDKRFNTIHQLTGQTFVPRQYAEGRGSKDDLKPGKVSIQIAERTVAFKGIEDLGVFSIVAKGKTRVGYEFKLLDELGRNFAKLKVVTNKYNNVQLVYFYAKKYGEHTFFLPRRTKSQLAKEKKYFTATNKCIVKDYAKLVGRTIKPAQMHKDVTNPNEVLTKIAMSDGLTVNFAADAVTFGKGKEKVVYEIKKVKKVKSFTNEDAPKVTQVLPIKVKGKTRKINLYLNEFNQLEYVGVQNTRYVLAK